MKYRSNIRACLFLLALLVPLAVLGKRLPPKPVAPVTGDGVTYSTAGDGIDEFVVASDVNSGKEQWRAKIYSVPIKKVGCGRQDALPGWDSFFLFNGYCRFCGAHGLSP